MCRDYRMLQGHSGPEFEERRNERLSLWSYCLNMLFWSTLPTTEKTSEYHMHTPTHTQSVSSLKPKKVYEVGKLLCITQLFTSSLHKPGMSFMLTDSLGLKKMRNTWRLLWSLHFSKSTIFQLPFFPPISEIVQSIPTHMLLSDRHPMVSDSTGKPGIVIPQFSQASKTVHPPENG